jgi:small subunit ribosomal protein S8
VILPYSKIKHGIADILKAEGYVGSVKVIKDKFRSLKIELKYDKNKLPVIQDIKRVSKVGRRVYVPKDKLPRVLNGLGIAVVSTSKGLLTAREARTLGLGGEVICEVY